MKTMFSRILLAQVVSVLLALVVVTAITRASLNQGFKQFLKTQESSVLETLVPVFGEFYENRGSWDFLRDNPLAWQRIWRNSNAQPGRPNQDGPRPRRGRAKEEFNPPEGPAAGSQLLRWMRMPERGMLRDRLYLLDENRMLIAGNEAGLVETAEREAIKIDNRIVGWLGFAPMGKVLPPEAERFLSGQVRITALSFAIAMVVAAALAWLLARNVSRPVRKLGDAIGTLSRGDYQARVSVEAGDEIGILARHVNDLATTLEKNRTARQRWMADIAHELRTPVAILKGEVEALTDGIRPADERFAASLQEEIDQLSKLVDDLQTLALSDAGALNIQKEMMDLARVAEQSVELYRDRLAVRGISIELRVHGSVNVSADPNRVRQLLQNLLENSCRYVEDHGRVVLTLLQGPGSVNIMLEDSGPGLTASQVPRLFERFYRAEGSRTRASGGTGLGLSICKNIAEAHGGRIHAEPSEIGGLKIQVDLPV